MTSFSRMSLYALTVKPPSAAQDAILGDFIGGKSSRRQQILTCNGSRLSLLRIIEKPFSFTEIHSQDVFAVVRRIAKFRIAGGTKDFIVISTDSGRMVTFEFLAEERTFKIVHFETYGKSGIRRVVPGEYLATDPKGRAIMVASAEKNKLVYILTRSGQTDIHISSPLEAHKPQTLVFCLIGLDVGYANPLFATLEVDYSNSELDSSAEAYDELQKEIVYYELDLGLNHVVRKWSEPVDRTANILFRVPGGPTHPSGVLVCGEDTITYRRIHNPKSGVHRVAIPRREGATEDPNRKRIIVCGALYTKTKGDFFYLLQTDDGDLFKLTVEAIETPTETGTEMKVVKIMIQYYDTIPVASSICILPAGFVYVACESGDRILYVLESLAEDSDEDLFSSDQFPVDPTAAFDPPFFKPRPLTNLNLEHGIALPGLNPIMGMEVCDAALEDAPQIYTINGTGGRSSFRTTRNALEVLDLIESQLPQHATNVWTTKLTIDDETDSLIVLGMHSTTLILKIGEEVEEAFETGILRDTNTLGVQQFGQDSVLQIHPKGIRRIQAIQFPNGDQYATNFGTDDWQPPAHRTIVACATNNRQAAIALSSGQILYFECDSDGTMAMAEQEIVLDSTITCLAIPDVPEGSVRAFFLAVGCVDQSVRIFNLTPDTEGIMLRDVSVQGLTSPPSDLTINYMTDKSPRGYSQFLHIGLRSGVYIRSVLDEMTGDIGDTRRRFLGPEPIKFAKVIVAGEPAIVAMTSRPWLAYTHPRTGVLQLTPLNYIPIKSAWNFEGSEFKGIICVSANELRIFTFNDLTDNTTYEHIPLKYTPKKMVGWKEQGVFYVIESEADTLNANVRQDLIQQSRERKQIEQSDIKKEEASDVKEEDGTSSSMEMIQHTNGESLNGTHESEEFPAIDFGYPRKKGKWASCIQVVDPVREKAVIHTIELNTNQALVSAALVFFESQGDEAFLAVGTATDMSFRPYRFSNASIQVYKISPDGRELELFHETEVSHPPTAMLGFKGKLIAGLGRNLCLYDCGMRSVLRKAQAPDCVTTRITSIKTQGSRLVVADSEQSVTYFVHKDQVHPNRLIPFVDDTIARWTTATEMLDYDTTVGGDKFGNIWLVRCPQKVSDSSDESPDGAELLVDRSYLGGTANRLDLVANYYTNDIPMAIQKTNLLAGGDRIIFWAGLQGTLGALIPFTSRRQHKMFQSLELQLRTEDKPLSGREHLAFRSTFNPVKGVIDGDLIERYLVLPQNMRESLAANITGGGEWTPVMVDEAIWNMRGLYVF
ncbi:pre-mRNA-splicing factor rse1 [Neocucurbitaria cava]|uniref:Pre-mRNA-splicing factor rse1 n=1 Tax=Neocucurbitaria cava TaxID=798079 RepID=A0A9W8YER8_9PLEO|nr:pre-mRNA-splicing factor rse1 [Neocucurbitaria cava]